MAGHEDDIDACGFVQRHGIVLASAKHALVPSLAQEIAGAPIRGSWWAHPKSHAIFRALSAAARSTDIVFTRLVDDKRTLVHARLWPALAALAKAGRIDPARLAKVTEEHTASGKHVTHATPFPDWLPAKLVIPDETEALRQLGPLAAAVVKPPPARRR
jgi:hypothetical protein